jgi:hypothetical protein
MAMGDSRVNRQGSGLAVVLSVLVGSLLLGLLVPLATGADSSDHANVTIVVKDAETEKPLQNARLTLQFHEEGGVARLKRSKMIAYSAKTNPQGRYKFTRIPKGTIRLLVTADHHQAFGKEYELAKDEVIEVKLRKPQPLL